MEAQIKKMTENDQRMEEKCREGAREDWERKVLEKGRLKSKKKVSGKKTWERSEAKMKWQRSGWRERKMEEEECGNCVSTA